MSTVIPPHGFDALVRYVRAFIAVSKPRKPSRFLLWVDAVGSVLVCEASTVRLGQAVPGNPVELPLLADISRHHATIRRDEGGYMIEPIRDVHIGSMSCRSTGVLPEGSLIALGSSARLRFSRSHPLSATARLDFASSHRTQPSADAVLLMADTCVLGPAPGSHVVCRQWRQEVVLYRHENELFCRTAGSFEVDGVRHRERAPLTLNSRISGDGFSFSLEEV